MITAEQTRAISCSRVQTIDLKNRTMEEAELLIRDSAYLGQTMCTLKLKYYAGDVKECNIISDVINEIKNNGFIVRRNREYDDYWGKKVITDLVISWNKHD